MTKTLLKQNQVTANHNGGKCRGRANNIHTGAPSLFFLCRYLPVLPHTALPGGVFEVKAIESHH